MKRLAGVRAYPFLLASYPALALLATNAEQVRLDAVVRPLILSWVLCALTYAALAAALRRRPPEAAAVLTSLWLVLFFAYGHVYAALRQVPFLDASLGRHRYLAVVWLVLALAGAVWVVRRKEWGGASRALTLAAAIAVLLPVLQVAGYLLETSLLAADRTGKSPAPGAAAAGLLPEGQILQLPATGSPPDVYYIILDGYGRSDTLEQVYGYDNSEFLAGLRRLGFVVAECAQSNYAQTELSIASSMNLLYLDELGDSFRPGTDNRRPLRPLIQSGAVRLALESLGYRTVAFETGYTFINLEDADRYLSPGLGSGLSGFELMFLRSTVGLVVLDSASVVPRLLAPQLHRSQDNHRELVRFAFDELERLPQAEGPKFVYAHIVSPHEPYVLDAEGNAVEAPEEGTVDDQVLRQAYADQARYVSRRTLTMLEALIAASEQPPVIVLQADHGPGLNSPAGRMGILNAYRFPGAEDVIDQGTSPVNSFRLVFNALFGTSFSRLPDVSHFSIYPAPYDFTRIQPSCPPEESP